MTILKAPFLQQSVKSDAPYLVEVQYIEEVTIFVIGPILPMFNGINVKTAGL